MRKKKIQVEHVDLEEKFLLSADVEFSSSEMEFSGVQEIAFPVPKKKKTETVKPTYIERKRKKDELF